MQLRKGSKEEFDNLLFVSGDGKLTATHTDGDLDIEVSLLAQLQMLDDAPDALQPFAAIARHRDLVPLAFQQEAHTFCLGGTVLDHQNLACHGAYSPAKARIISAIWSGGRTCSAAPRRTASPGIPKITLLSS